MHMNGDSMHLGGYAPVDLIKRTPTGQELIQRYGRSFVIQEGRTSSARGVEFYRGTQKRRPLRGIEWVVPRLDVAHERYRNTAALPEIAPTTSNKISTAVHALLCVSPLLPLETINSWIIRWSRDIIGPPGISAVEVANTATVLTNRARRPDLSLIRGVELPLCLRIVDRFRRGDRIFIIRPALSSKLRHADNTRHRRSFLSLPLLVSLC